MPQDGASCEETRVPFPPGIFPTNYHQWRPTFHLQPACYWMNDPCAPLYNKNTQTYHLFFQHNPQSNNWGTISWCQATSRDLINWTIQNQPALKPDQVYDKDGVFTGAAFPEQADGTITVAYTAVSQLPIHYTLPYAIGSEKLALASSADNGVTWIKHASNPVMRGPPKGMEVTAWRDPYINYWPNMSKLLNHTPQDWFYGIISGGIRGKTPTIFLYEIDATDYTNWRYISPLIDLGFNFNPSRWVGDFGVNWEVTNFHPLTSVDGEVMDVLIMGVEGILPTISSLSSGKRPTRPSRAQKWLTGPLQLDSDDSPKMKFSTGGTLDHGCFYAANSFRDPASGDFITWGWITEDDLPDSLREIQGWSGCLSLPRRLFIQTLRNVVRSRASPLREIGNFEATKEKNGAYTLRTLGVEPISELQSLRSISNHFIIAACTALRSGNPVLLPFNIVSRFELRTSICLSPTCRSVSLKLLYDTSDSYCIFTYDPIIETFTIDRSSISQPSKEHPVNNRDESAPHTLFTFIDIEGTEKEETLDIHIFQDMSVVEVFVNKRTCISTRLYGVIGRCFGAEVIGEDEGVCSMLMKMNVWQLEKARMEYV
ncbi:Arabinanase/levansucrase/invertase [Ascobolus immersus RN42]|uniref:Arabinanase/levansucrase/invertase n=1 Tax=Ascobolus immersus RN42 TaxID=1160509 RepID=A0A3N4HRH2_ASCIM|nr:Arabinanase/levansucrase/invertase [Ascobolus immersus RN42]